MPDKKYNVSSEQESFEQENAETAEESASYATEKAAASGSYRLTEFEEEQDDYKSETQASYRAYQTGVKPMLSGLFRDRESAERAYNTLRNRGYTDDDINVIMSDEARDRWFAEDDYSSELGSKTLEGAGAGSATGGTLGAIIGGIAAIGTNVMLPGLGLVASGPLAAALAGAGAGGLTGGLVGALIGSGIPEERAKYYDEGIRNGGVVIGVNPRASEDAEYFENEWRNYRGEHIYGGVTPVKSIEPREVLEVKQISAWIAERESVGDKPLEVNKTYTLNFMVGGERSVNLISSTGKIIPVSDIPESGLDTRWLIVSKNVVFTEFNSREDVRIKRLSDSEPWSAEFSLHIPKSGDSRIVWMSIVPLTSESAELQVCIFAEQRIYRQFTVELNVQGGEKKPLDTAPNNPANSAAKIKDEVTFSRADELRFQPTQEWTTPPGDLTITVLKDDTGAMIAGDLVIESGEVIWDITPRYTGWYAKTANVNPLIKQLRAAAKQFCDDSAINDYLNDLDAVDLVDKLSTAAAQNASDNHSFAYDHNSDAPHLSIWETRVASSNELIRLASFGYLLYDSIFPSGTELRVWLDALPPEWLINIVWSQNSGSAYIPNIPWGMIYSRNPQNEPFIDPTNFWGLRFRLNYIAYPPKVKSKSLGSDREIHKAGCFYWGDQPGDDVAIETQWQRSQWQDWINQTFIPAADSLDKMTALRGFLISPAPSPLRFLYFFCHCKIDENSGLTLRFGNTNKAGDLVDQIGLGLSPIADEPLVFVNACSSAAGDTYDSNQLVETFMGRRGCRAFIGTEIDMPVTLASRFALVFSYFFFRRITTRKITAGEAFYQARLFLWHHYRNIGGIFYTFINEHDLFIDDPKEQNVRSTNTEDTYGQNIYR